MRIIVYSANYSKKTHYKNINRVCYARWRYFKLITINKTRWRCNLKLKYKKHEDELKECRNVY